ncbi:hypothetical protein JCGZ_01582 [Jatropha curcas]|uniref:Uncharacterized protein n=1 Tax=Jatropha curcas TaxID=180498 RepID=A0A067L4Y5_JATCU|nr:hypothetical protein JCGZ_01582 [Jatropha curcas]
MALLWIQLLLRVLPEPSLRPGLEIITWLGPYLILPVFILLQSTEPGSLLLFGRLRGQGGAAIGGREGRAQVCTDDAGGTDEEIVMAPRTGEVREGLAPKDDSEDVAPRRRRDA